MGWGHRLAVMSGVSNQGQPWIHRGKQAPVGRLVAVNN